MMRGCGFTTMVASGIGLVLYLIGIPVGLAWVLGFAGAIYLNYRLRQRGKARDEAAAANRSAARQAQASAPTPPRPAAAPEAPASVTQAPKGAADEIAKLADLREKGLISEEEYVQGKRRALSGD